MHANTCFARQIKRHPYLPTVRNQTDNVMWRTCAKLEALDFNTGIISHSNTAGRDATTATPCGQNSATSNSVLSGSYDVWGGTHATNPLKKKTVYITFACYLAEMRVNTCFALQVNRPSSLPTDLNQTDNVS